LIKNIKLYQKENSDIKINNNGKYLETDRIKNEIQKLKVSLRNADTSGMEAKIKEYKNRY